MLVVNQTTLPVEKGCPARFVLPDHQTSWDMELPEYVAAPLYHTRYPTTERLEAKGIIVHSDQELRRLGTFSTRQAMEEYGEAIRDVRNPLGRTGINGVGAIWEAGDSGTADFAVGRRTSAGLEIALIRNRGRWGLPGGFVENEKERRNRRLAGIREAQEETGLDLSAVIDKVVTLVPLHVKPNSKRSADLGWITTQVDAVLLGQPAEGDGIRPNDDAEEAGWFTAADMSDLPMSKDHRSYAEAAMAYFTAREAA